MNCCPIQVFEFLSISRIPREESDDLARIMDSDTNGVVTLEELMGALDNCPKPEIREVPVEKTRPMVNFQGTVGWASSVDSWLNKIPSSLFQICCVNLLRVFATLTSHLLNPIQVPFKA